MFSNLDTSVREQVAVQLQSLGAVISNSVTYDPSCTHLIIERPIRNEKVLASIATGKWILHISYVKQSVAAGKLIDVSTLCKLKMVCLKKVMSFKRNVTNSLAYRVGKLPVLRRENENNIDGMRSCLK